MSAVMRTMISSTALGMITTQKRGGMEIDVKKYKARAVLPNVIGGIAVLT